MLVKLTPIKLTNNVGLQAVQTNQRKTLAGDTFCLLLGGGGLIWREEAQALAREFISSEAKTPLKTYRELKAYLERGGSMVEFKKAVDDEQLCGKDYRLKSDRLDFLATIFELHRDSGNALELYGLAETQHKLLSESDQNKDFLGILTVRIHKLK